MMPGSCIPWTYNSDPRAFWLLQMCSATYATELQFWSSHGNYFWDLLTVADWSLDPNDHFQRSQPIWEQAQVQYTAFWLLKNNLDSFSVYPLPHKISLVTKSFNFLASYSFQFSFNFLASYSFSGPWHLRMADITYSSCSPTWCPSSGAHCHSGIMKHLPSYLPLRTDQQSGKSVDVGVWVQVLSQPLINKASPSTNPGCPFLILTGNTNSAHLTEFGKTNGMMHVKLFAWCSGIQ